MGNNFTDTQKEQIKEAEEKQRIILRLLQGEKLKDVLKDASKEVLFCAETWSRLKKKYLENGFLGLIDSREGGSCYKVDNEIIEYIKREKKNNFEINGAELQKRIKVRSGKTITRQWIDKILRRLKLSGLRGRPKKEIKYDPAKGKPVDHAGCWFLKGADWTMMGIEGITKIVDRKREEYITRYGKEKSFRTLVSNIMTIKKKNETLLYLPVFGMKRPKELERYHKSGLGLITGGYNEKRYRYSTIDKHQRELEKLKVSEGLSQVLARCYTEAFFIKIELKDNESFYIDGHFKTVWSDKNIPRGFRTTLNKTEKSLEQVILNSSKGHPLILLTCPGDRHLTKELFNLIDAFEGAVGKEIIKISIFDREGLSLKIFKEFDRRKRYFITLLKENQYKGIESFKIKKGFIPYVIKENRKEIKSMIADAEITLKDREEKQREKQKYGVRVGLVMKEPEGIRKLIPVITNITEKEEPEIKKIADKYFARWPCQENIIKDMMYGVEWDSNHGYKKKEVENRTMLRRKEELEKNIANLRRQMEPVKEEIKKLEKEIETIEQLYQGQIKELNKDKNELHYKLLLDSKEKTKKEYISELKVIEEKMLNLTKNNEKQLYLLRNKLEDKKRYERGKNSEKENKEEELVSLDMEQKLYEVLTEKDSIMTNFKMLLYNLSRYAREQWFSPEYENATFGMLRDKIYSHDGYVKLGRRNMVVTLNPYDDDELQRDVESACMKFNSADVRNSLGRRLEIHVEPQQKSGGNPDVTRNLSF